MNEVTVKVTKMPPPVPPPDYVITLSETVARELRTVLGAINSGNAEGLYALFNQLDNAGVASLGRLNCPSVPRYAK